MNVLQPNVFLILMHRLLVTNKERSVLPSTNTRKSQDQLQTPQSVSVRGDMNWIYVLEDTVHWWAVISIVINFCFAEIVGNSSTS